MLLFARDKFIFILFLVLELSVIPVFADQLTNNNNPFSNQKCFCVPTLGEKCAHVFVQFGGYLASQGKSQDIDIDTLIGNRYTVSHHTDKNLMIGLGYFINGIDIEKLSVLYGINAFYLAPTQVKGNIIQENLLTNLSYKYSITNWPIYVSAKSFFDVNNNYNITFDLGVGPNIIVTHSYSESSLDSGITIPDNNSFSGESHVALSATIGFGVKLLNLTNQFPVEIGYRFFYLGKGYLKKQSDQIQDNLSTGDSYANALIFSISL